MTQISSNLIVLKYHTCVFSCEPSGDGMDQL